jgi:hypothetical protein
MRLRTFLRPKGAPVRRMSGWLKSGSPETRIETMTASAFSGHPAVYGTMDMFG